MKYILAKNISTIIGIGYISKMPGTLGSLVGLIIGTIGLKYLPFIFKKFQAALAFRNLFQGSALIGI